MHLIQATTLAVLAALAPAPSARPAPAAGGCEMPFPAAPLDVAGVGVHEGLELSFHDAGRALLDEQRAVVLTGLLLPDGSTVDLELERFVLDVAHLELRVDGQPARYDVGRHASLWRGRVAGEPDSDVFLGFSELGSRGWIRRDESLHHLLAGPGADGTWTNGRSLLVAEPALNARGHELRSTCGVDARHAPFGVPATTAAGAGLLGLTTTLLECRVALETDYQLYQRFNSIPALQNYVTQLFAAASARFDADVQVVLTPAYLGMHSNANDGWTSPDTGAGSGAMLDEFRLAWQNAIPGGAQLAHFVSGAGLGGGVAYLDVLCNPFWGFAVSGDLAGNTPFPVVQGPLNWDFFVFAHETGHNFGTPHTHDFCPPLDQCSPAGSYGQCQNTQVCITNGTIMSYCHLCNGGVANIVPAFHPTTAALMRSRSEASCLGVLCHVPVTYCPFSPNSYDPFGAQMDYWGTPRVSRNDLVLATTSVPPGASALYFYGRNQVQVPFGNGWRCIGSPVFRLPATTASIFADVTRPLDLTALPPGGQIQAGETWNFQLWYRNPAAGGAGFNLSNGLTVQFCP